MVLVWKLFQSKLINVCKFFFFFSLFAWVLLLCIKCLLLILLCLHSLPAWFILLLSLLILARVLILLRPSHSPNAWSHPVWFSLFSYIFFFHFSSDCCITYIFSVHSHYKLTYTPNTLFVPSFYIKFSRPSNRRNNSVHYRHSPESFSTLQTCGPILVYLHLTLRAHHIFWI